MNLVTPDSGLLFWMVLIFGLVFFLLARYGFPVITQMVEKRNGTIEKSLRDAEEIEARMASMLKEHQEMIDEARKEQAAILREATETKNRILSEAEAQARASADRILSEARTEIAAEKESALRDVRKEVALLSVQVAERVLRQNLSEEGNQRAYLDQLVDEAFDAQLLS